MKSRVMRTRTTLLTTALIALLTLPAVAGLVQVGDRAPDFKLAATTGGEIKLSDFQGKQMVLVEFYHADWAPT